MNGGLATNTMPTTYHAKQYDNDGECHNKRNGGSCMAIYLRMAMKMP